LQGHNLAFQAKKIKPKIKRIKTIMIVQKRFSMPSGIFELFIFKNIKYESTQEINLFF
jgi:flagellar biosynthesis protein FlhB